MALGMKKELPDEFIKDNIFRHAELADIPTKVARKNQDRRGNLQEQENIMEKTIKEKVYRKAIPGYR